MRLLLLLVLILACAGCGDDLTSPSPTLRSTETFRQHGRLPRWTGPYCKLPCQ